jgi:serine/threonine protein kinase
LPTDIKPDNIMVNRRGTGPEMTVKQVQIIDLENAAYLPKGRCIKGMLPGNDSWRSPEGHFKGELDKPADIFSFAAVVGLHLFLGDPHVGLTESPSASTPCSDRSSLEQTMI